MNVASVRCLFAAAIALMASAPALAQTADFGNPPSGQIPILFNDRHVYSKPDKLKAGRVLAALVRNNTILVPLRSLFEQTGATVSWDPGTKTVDVSKPGADVRVTVGKASVSINGEERPLDVPPEFYRGAVVVPLRVISEGMGAYVQWIPDKHLVVVRYIPVTSTPPPPPTATATPVPAGTAPPVPAATTAPTSYERYIVGDYVIAPRVFNELSAGNLGNRSFDVKAVAEFKLLGPTFFLEGDYRRTQYPHYSYFSGQPCTTPGVYPCNTVNGGDNNYSTGPCARTLNDPGCVTSIGASALQAQGGLGQSYVTAFTARDSDFDLRFGGRIGNPKLYVGVGYLRKNYNYLGYPNLGGVGFGFEKLPELEHLFSIYGSAWYYPNVRGEYTYPNSQFLGTLANQKIELSYQALKYAVGGTLSVGGQTGIFINLGYEGERLNGRSNAPSSTTINAPFAGLGVHF